MVIIVRTDEGQPRLKYIFKKCGTNIFFFTLQRFGPSQSPSFEINVFILGNPENKNDGLIFPTLFDVRSKDPKSLQLNPNLQTPTCFL